MKHFAPIMLLLLTTMAFNATNMALAIVDNGAAGTLQVAKSVLSVSNENGFDLSIVEIFILVFCFLFAVGLVLLWQFCLRKKR